MNACTLLNQAFLASHLIMFSKDLYEISTLASNSNVLLHLYLTIIQSFQICLGNKKNELSHFDEGKVFCLYLHSAQCEQQREQCPTP